MMNKRFLAILLILMLAASSFGCAQLLNAALQPQSPTATPAPTVALTLLDDDGDAPPPLGTDAAEPPSSAARTPAPTEAPLDEAGSYTSASDLANYLYIYGRLPDNFIDKDEARALGWSGGGLDRYAYGKCIGGDRFGNFEGLLPKKSGRTYYECDIDTLHKSSRGAKRIVFSNDGLIYYTEDHYESFRLLYGEE